ncbi:MAG: hypothetical protein E7463_08255 [Ruminococcaceae bacterium]|nr:hypothetical protein [Oscillospiraceae bacterium]
MNYILSFDIGTSGVKCGIFDETLACLVITRRDYEVSMNPDGTVEADPEAYIRAMTDCSREALAVSCIPAADVRALAITTQGETLIPIDRAGNPLSRAIVWLDGRASAEADTLRSAFPDRVFRAKTGLPSIDGYVPLAKLAWIKAHIPEIYAKTYKFLLLEDYAIFRLTGRTVSEKALLTSTGYFDLTTDDLWDEALEAVGISRSMLPDVVDPGARIGALTPEAASLLGLTENTIVYAGAMDQLSGAVGCGNIADGCIHETTGTAMIVGSTMNLADSLASNPELTIYRHAEKDKYLLLSIGRTATTILKWFAEQFYANEPQDDIYAHLSEVAAAGVPGAGGIVLLPYFEGTIGSDGAENLRGCFWNVGLHNTRGDFVRAIFEGVAYMLRDNLALMPQGKTSDRLISIGGASASDIWCRIKAAVTGLEIVTMAQEETTLFGCACIAAVGCGLYPDLAAAVGRLEISRRYVPEEAGRLEYDALYDRYLRMKASLEKLASQV